MKISMWMIAEQLHIYEPICDIKTGEACIDAVRFISETGENRFEDNYVYLCSEHDEASNAETSVVLINGQDLIVIRHQDLEDVLNSVLAAFEFYNRWESTLWSLSSRGSAQELIDHADQVLGNPLLLCDPDGNIIAMSSRYRENDLNENWVSCRESGQVPTAILGTPQYSPGNESVVWNTSAQIMFLPDGTKTIGCLVADQEQVIAALGLWEVDTPVHPGHLALVRILCSAIVAALQKNETAVSYRSSVSILLDLLDGVSIDQNLLQSFELRCPKPWRLICVLMPFQTNVVSLRNLQKRMASSGLTCIPFIYRDVVLCLVPAEKWDLLISRILGKREQAYYTVMVSMPFDDLAALPVRYQQNMFGLNETPDGVGIFHAENTGMRYALSLVQQRPDAKYLAHPALDVLRRYDQENEGDLYRSLYFYLLYEGSIQQAAQAVHVHRNSFLYRIKRILSLTQIDLEDPLLRAYLLFSFLLNESEAEAVLP